MSEHTIEFTTKNAYLGKGSAGITFSVYIENEKGRTKKGTLMVSRGAVYWIERFKGKDRKIKKTWEDLRIFFEGK